MVGLAFQRDFYQLIEISQTFLWPGPDRMRDKPIAALYFLLTADFFENHNGDQGKQTRHSLREIVHSNLSENRVCFKLWGGMGRELKI